MLAFGAFVHVVLTDVHLLGETGDYGGAHVPLTLNSELEAFPSRSSDPLVNGSLAEPH